MFFANVSNQRFYDIDVKQMIQGRLVEVVERDLMQDGENFDYFVDENMESEKKIEGEGNDHKPALHVEENAEIEENQKQNLVVNKHEPETARTSIPMPTLPMEILDLHRRLNLTNPGRFGAPLTLDIENMDLDLQLALNRSREKYQINEFASSLIPLDRDLPDIRSDYCKEMRYSQDLPVASVIMVLHNEAISMILRSVYAVINRSPEHLLREIILVDDCSTIGK